MPVVDGYTAHLYCDHPDHSVWDEIYPVSTEYLDPERGSRARQQARKDGWLIKRDGTCFCPRHNPNRKGLK